MNRKSTQRYEKENLLIEERIALKEGDSLVAKRKKRKLFELDSAEVVSIAHAVIIQYRTHKETAECYKVTDEVVKGIIKRVRKDRNYLTHLQEVEQSKANL